MFVDWGLMGLVGLVDGWMDDAGLDRRIYFAVCGERYWERRGEDGVGWGGVLVNW